jgi:hypothetical protein
VELTIVPAQVRAPVDHGHFHAAGVASHFLVERLFRPPLLSGRMSARQAQTAAVAKPRMSLLFCHAAGFCAEVWRPVIDELSALARQPTGAPELVMSAIDLPGTTWTRLGLGLTLTLALALALTLTGTQPARARPGGRGGAGAAAHA